MTAANELGTSKLLAWLQLFRAPNVFTAVADVSMGFLFVAGAPAPLAPLAALIAASGLLYTAGMVLNDVYDYDIDQKERPQRPLPSGRISLSAARTVGYGLLLSGVMLGWLAGFSSSEADLPWRSGLMATLLAACVVSYDCCAKRTPLGPLTMGGCRFLNILLGMSAAPVVVPDESLALGYNAAQLLVAGGIGVYIVGVTWFARTETETRSNSALLFAATWVMLWGVIMLAGYPMATGAPPLQLVGLQLGEGLSPIMMWWVLLAMVALPVIGRCLAAAANPASYIVQMAIKRCIISLIMFDAAITLAAVGPWPALAVLALLLPTMFLGMWIYST